MKEYDIEFEINQKSIYSMSVKAETPEQAIELARHEDFDRSEAEEDIMIESWDNVDTIKVTGEWYKNKRGGSSLMRFKKPIKQEAPLFEIYKENHGYLCPECGSAYIDAGPFNASDMDAWRDVDCRDCETTWREMFTMQNIDIL